MLVLDSADHNFLKEETMLGRVMGAELCIGREHFDQLLKSPAFSIS
jgi:hypothetical protein